MIHRKYIPKYFQPENFIENISTKTWSGNTPPKKILVIRLEAAGDLFVSFPLISDLKKQLPDTQIDLLTRQDYAELPKKLNIFSNIIGFNRKIDGFAVNLVNKFRILCLLPSLFLQRYDVILDLQRNSNTRLVRYFLFPRAWTELDRFSNNSAVLRYQWSINQVGFPVELDYTFAHTFHQKSKTTQLLQKHGYKSKNTLVILNPAGAFLNRNWDVENYLAFIELWLEYEKNVQFIFLGVSKIQEKVEFIKSKFPSNVINLVELTTMIEAYGVVLEADIILTEDSGLGHWSWLSGKKTIMLLGSTRHDWVSPYGEHTICFNSSDLECGDCMLEVCPYEEIICMSRITANSVFSEALKLHNN